MVATQLATEATDDEDGDASADRTSLGGDMQPSVTATPGSEILLGMAGRSGRPWA